MQLRHNMPKESCSKVTPLLVRAGLTCDRLVKSIHVSNHSLTLGWMHQVRIVSLSRYMEMRSCPPAVPTSSTFIEIDSTYTNFQARGAKGDPSGPISPPEQEFVQDEGPPVVFQVT